MKTFDNLNANLTKNVFKDISSIFNLLTGENNNIQIQPRENEEGMLVIIEELIDNEETRLTWNIPITKVQFKAITLNILNDYYAALNDIFIDMQEKEEDLRHPLGYVLDILDEVYFNESYFENGNRFLLQNGTRAVVENKKVWVSDGTVFNVSDYSLDVASNVLDDHYSIKRKLKGFHALSNELMKLKNKRFTVNTLSSNLNLIFEFEIEIKKAKRRFDHNDDSLSCIISYGKADQELLEIQYILDNEENCFITNIFLTSHTLDIN